MCKTWFDLVFDYPHLRLIADVSVLEIFIANAETMFYIPQHNLTCGKIPREMEVSSPGACTDKYATRIPSLF